MNIDNLEKYIIGNRDEFDDLEPSSDLWEKIGKPEGRKIKVNWKSVLMKAAAIVVIFISSYYFHDFMQYRKGNIAISDGSGQNEAILKLNEASYYYTSQIGETKAAVFHLIGNDPELKQDINSELVDLDKVLKELKEDLKDNVNSEEVVEAMIQNYRLKLTILNDILKQLESSNKKQKNELKKVNL